MKPKLASFCMSCAKPNFWGATFCMSCAKPNHLGSIKLHMMVRMASPPPGRTVQHHVHMRTPGKRRTARSTIKTSKKPQLLRPTKISNSWVVHPHRLAMLSIFLSSRGLRTLTYTILYNLNRQCRRLYIYLCLHSFFLPA